METGSCCCLSCIVNLKQGTRKDQPTKPGSRLLHAKELGNSRGMLAVATVSARTNLLPRFVTPGTLCSEAPELQARRSLHSSNKLRRPLLDGDGTAVVGEITASSSFISRYPEGLTENSSTSAELTCSGVDRPRLLFVVQIGQTPLAAIDTRLDPATCTAQAAVFKPLRHVREGC